MSLPDNFKSVIATSNFSVMHWIEIEGIPNAYGSIAQADTFFGSRVPKERFDAILAHLESIPSGVEQTLDTLEGVAASVGQFEFRIVDVNGDPLEWAGIGNQSGWVSLAAELAYNATSIPYQAGLPVTAPGVIYLGTETIKFDSIDGGTGDLTDLTRGAYRSLPQTWGAGTPISTRPYTIAKRRCWYNQCVKVPGSPFNDSDRGCLFAGTLEGFRMDKDPAVFILTVESLERSLTRDCFRELRQVRDSSEEAITGPLGNEPGLRVAGMRGWNQDNDENLSSVDAKDFEADEKFLLRVDDEIMAFVESSGKLKLTARGLYGTQITAHDKGFVGKEVVGVIAYDSDTTSRIENQWSKFTSAPTSESALYADHPLILLLQILLSTGTGLNESLNRNYDVLPESWGMGIEDYRIDVEGIEAAAQYTAELRYGGVIEEPIAFLELCKNILRSLGYYGLTVVGDQFTVKYLRPPMPGETSRTLTNAHRISKSRPGWDANLSGLVRSLTVNYAFDILKGEFSRIHVERFTDANIYSKGEGRDLEYDALLLYPGGLSTVPGTPPNLPFDVETMLLRRADFIRPRYTRPPPIITERVDYSFLDVEVGDLIAITSDNLPNVETGARGITAELGEVIRKRVDLRSKTIELSILHTNYQVEAYRYTSPACQTHASGGIVGKRIYVERNQFTDAFDASGETDLTPRAISGAATAWLRPTELVGTWDRHFRAFQLNQVDSIDYNGTPQSVLLIDPISIAVAYITKASYNASMGGGIAYEKDVFAWGANDLDVLAASTPHRYFP